MQLRALPHAFYHAARLHILDLSPEAQEKLRWLRAWEALRAQGLSSDQASAVLEIPRSTLFRWRRRMERDGPQGLEARSRRPRRRRRPTWSPELAQSVLRLREERPRWGKDKLTPFLREAGWQVSTSMVGRILRRLRETRALVEPPRRLISSHRRSQPRPYAIRKPRGYAVSRPGDLVQVDTKDLRPLPGVTLKQFTARDVISRWDVLDVRSRATARTAAEFLEAIEERMPYPIRAIQVDGGSEFKAQFESACQEKGIALFVLPPHSPKLNGYVERAHRTHVEEFWELYDGDLDLASVRPALRAWERTYNTVRPHQSLAGRTPAGYLIECHPELAPPALPVSHVLNEYTTLTRNHVTCYPVPV